jgi:hypothetical protein
MTHEGEVPFARVQLRQEHLFKLPQESGKVEYLYGIPVVWTD